MFERVAFTAFTAYAISPGSVPNSGIFGGVRLLHASFVQRKVINGYRAMWATEGEATNYTVVDTARVIGNRPFGLILKTVGA